MRCAGCNLVSEVSRCLVCGRALVPSEVLKSEGSPPAESLDAVLMDVEQRGLLIITIFSDGSRVMHLLPPYDRAWN